MNDYDYMVRAAWMYYEDELTHAQIARKLHLSRVKVTRLLKRAREQGIVEIRVMQPVPPDMEMSRQLEAAFGLQEAVVVASDTSEQLARAAAEMLLYLIESGQNIGFGWSSTVSQMATYVPRQDAPCDCTVVDLVGSMLGKANPYSVSGKIADALQAQLLPLAVPVMVSSAHAHDTLLAEPGIHNTIAAARSSRLAFVGVGEVGPTNTLVEIGYLPPRTMDDLQAAGAVGEMLMRYFDINGNPVPNDADERIIGLRLDDLRQIPNVVLVAYGNHKADALLGALRSGIPQTFITDMSTATLLLDAQREST
jgi:DNA-binding transcriptional regulator LsrR (DeoR family)